MGKSVGQVVGGITGAIAGFFLGGPLGAVQGFGLGTGLGGAIDPPKGPTIKGPRLDDLSAQTSSFGAGIGRTYGTVGVSGNIIWVKNNQIDETITKEKQGGKGGGGGQTVESAAYFGTFAVRICDNPIALLSKIWINDRLFYHSGATDTDSIAESLLNSSYFTIYHGEQDQDPDPDIEADLGVNQTPAFRGSSYIVFKDLPLEPYSNSLAGVNVTFEVSEIGTGGVVPGTAELITWTPTGVVNDGSFFVDPDGYFNRFVGSSSSGTSPAGQVYVFRRVDIDGNTTTDRNLWREFLGAYVDPVQHSHRSGDEYFMIGYHTGISPNAWACFVDTPTSQSVFFTVPDYYTWFRDMSSYGENIYIYALSNSNEPTYGAGQTLILRYSGQTLEQTYSLTEAYGRNVPVDGMYATLGLLFLLETAIDSIHIHRADDLQYLTSYGVDSIFAGGGGVTPDKLVIAEGHVVSARNNASSGMWIQDLGNEFIAPKLSAVVLSELLKSEIISESDIDVTDLDQDCAGIRLAGQQTPRQNITPLMQSYNFDMISSGYKIKALSRGAVSSATIDYSDFMGKGLSISRQMDNMLTQQISTTYIDSTRAYRPNSQLSYNRDSSLAASKQEVQLPVALTSTEAASIADTMMELNWLERQSFSFTLPPSYNTLSAGDVVTLTTESETYSVRIVRLEVQQSGVISVDAKTENPSIYTPNALGQDSVANDDTIDSRGDTTFLMLDIPLLRDSEDRVVFGAALSSDSGSWPGGILYRSIDGGTTYDRINSNGTRVFMGTFTGTLGSDDGRHINEDLTCNIDMIAGTLESVTLESMLSGKNTFVYGDDGRWGVGRFQNATLEGDGTYTLDTFVLGQRGTESAAASVVADDYFILIDDPDIITVDAQVSNIGISRKYKGVTSGSDIDSVTAVDFAYNAVNLTPLPGTNGTKELSGSDWVVSWNRRSRFTDNFWTSGVQPVVGESSENYEIVFNNGTSDSSVYTSTTDSITYTAAQQTTDFGGTVSELTVKVYQMSSVVGRGFLYQF